MMQTRISAIYDVCMATLNQMVAEQTKVISEARASLEAAFKKPPTQTAVIAAERKPPWRN
jgi:uncharacterized coiled-coil protein SlyX